MMEYQLTEANISRRVTDKHIAEISLSYCKKWRLLLSQFEMKNIVADDIGSKNIDADEMRQLFLSKWKEEKGSEATYKVLLSALLKIKQKKETEGVCKLISPLFSSTPTGM